MAQLIGVYRLGRDVEVRYLPDGTAVANLALACNYGKKDNDGNRPSQWVDASLWGDRADKLAPYLLKSQEVYVIIEDPHVESYQKRDGTAGSKLVGRVASLEFVGGRRDGQQQGNQQQARQQAASTNSARQTAPRHQQSQQESYTDDFSDDIPF